VTSRDIQVCHKLEVHKSVGIGLDFADGHKEYFIARLSEDKIREIIDDLRGECGIIYFLEAEEEALKKAADLGLIPVKIKEGEMEVMA